MNVERMYEGLKVAPLTYDVRVEVKKVLRKNEKSLQKMLDGIMYKAPTAQDWYIGEIKKTVGELLNPLLEQKGVSDRDRQKTYDAVLSLI